MRMTALGFYFVGVTVSAQTWQGNHDESKVKPYYTAGPIDRNQRQESQDARRVEENPATRNPSIIRAERLRAELRLLRSIRALKWYPSTKRPSGARPFGSR